MSKPPTIEALDKRFFEWVKRQPSCLTGQFSEWHDGVGFSIPCHVRRAGKAGIAYKPPFSAVPMTNDEHRTQSDHGEVACLLLHAGRAFTTHGYSAVPDAKRFFDQQAELYRNRWLASQGQETQKIVRDAL